MAAMEAEKRVDGGKERMSFTEYAATVRYAEQLERMTKTLTEEARKLEAENDRIRNGLSSTSLYLWELEQEASTLKARHAEIWHGLGKIHASPIPQSAIRGGPDGGTWRPVSAPPMAWASGPGLANPVPESVGFFQMPSVHSHRYHAVDHSSEQSLFADGHHGALPEWKHDGVDFSGKHSHGVDLAFYSKPSLAQVERA